MLILPHVARMSKDIQEFSNLLHNVRVCDLTLFQIRVRFVHFFYNLALKLFECITF